MATEVRDSKFLSGLLQTGPDGKESWPEFVQELKSKAEDDLATLPFPTTRHEEWKYCNLRPLSREQFTYAGSLPAATVEAVDSYVLDESRSQVLTFINGIYKPEYSHTGGLPDNVAIGSLKEHLESHGDLIRKHLGQYAQYDDDLFTPLNTRTFEDGAWIHVPADTKLDNPVHVLNIHTDSEQQYYTTPRCLIVAGTHSHFTVVEEHIGMAGNTYFTCPVTEIALDEGANVTHVKLQRDSRQAYHIGRIASGASKNSEYHSYSIHIGSKLNRNDVRAVLQDEQTHATLDGLVLVKGDQLSDTHSTMEHKYAHCTSHQLHKCVVDDKASSVFNGKIFVDPGAQKTDAFQENRNLQLSKNAEVNTKPQLEIYADDVSCSHGATVGHLDADQKFYLKSRGLNEVITRQILTYGFALDIIESIPIPSLQQRLSREVENYVEAELLQKDIA